MKINSELKEQILSQAFFKGRIVSGSMVPVINIGEEIMVEIKARDLKRFDIIVFWQDEMLICHYLWNMNRFIKPILMQTRNISGGKDYPIKDEDYIGKVVSHKLSFLRKLKIIFSK
ncbi:MAG: S24 family peptidase [Bdellovibrionales bacterium]|nr:S24 family peptidase [Bdellovibrionales bacterium]